MATTFEQKHISPPTSSSPLTTTTNITTTTPKLFYTKPLPPNLQIRELTLRDSPHAAAIHFHANIFHAPKWVAEYRGRQTSACLNAFRYGKHLFDEPIIRGGGLCWGIFDTSLEVEGDGEEGVFWEPFGDGKDISDEEGGKLLLKAMKFSLVSVCFSYDDFTPPSKETMTMFVQAMPEAIHIYSVMNGIRKAQLDANSEFVKTDRMGWRLKRAGTATRGEYQGKGLMRALTGWALDRAREQGWESVLGNTSAGAVAKVWLSFGGKIVCRVNVQEWEDENGVRVFEKSGGEESVGIEIVL